MTEAKQCPFCQGLEAGAEVMTHGTAAALHDGFPVSPGHTLVVPRRHVGSLFDLAPEEQQDIWALVARVRERLNADHQVDGFNVGLNDGPAAGQTVLHAHVHVIPRYEGDLPDPRGGVRWVIPAKADYWSDMAL